MSRDLKHVVFIGNKNSVFVKQSAQELVRNGVHVDIVDPYNPELSSIKGCCARIRRLLHRVKMTRKELKKLGPFDVAVIHYLKIDTVWLVPLLKRSAHRVVGFAYGSDILQRRPHFNSLLNWALSRLDCLCATNQNVLAALSKRLPEANHNKLQLIRFGLPVFDELDKLIATKKSKPCFKRELGFDLNKIIVALGYNASAGQRQVELIHFFLKQHPRFNHIQFVIPIQYGSEKNCKKIAEMCAVANDAVGRTLFLPITEFFDVCKSAKLRFSSDLLINYAVSDAFSGTVQETVFAGNCVLSGRHLPYEQMPGFGTAIRPFGNLQDCADFLTPSSVKDLMECAQRKLTSNRNALRNVSSWDSVIDDWLRMLFPEQGDGVLKDQSRQ